jgi:signal transduction histidine kinase
LDIQSVSPYQIVDNSLNTVITSAKEKALQVEKKMRDDLPNIKADPDKVSWVLNNFLTNAIRYAPIESVITISVDSVDGQLSFAVSDKGQGIEKVYLGRIFERYFQIPSRSDKKGSGIGLAICKEFIEAMHGTIWVKSGIGEGSTFGFNLTIS